MDYVLEKLEYWLRDRREMKDFLSLLRKEQEESRANRPEQMEWNSYELQAGMLPKNYMSLQPRKTKKHHNDFIWSKSRKV